MRVDFFRIESSMGQALADAFDVVSNLANDESRTREIGHVPFRIRRLKHSTRYWDGDMLRIRMNDVPLKVTLGGAESNVELDEDEGIGETTAFRYDLQTQVLAIQVSKSGVAASKWAAFFDLFTATDLALVPTNVKQGSPGRAISKLDQVRKVHIRYAGVTDAGLVVNPLGPVQSGIEDAAETAPVLEVTVSMGHERGSLPIAWARQILSDACERAKNYITGLPRVERVDVIGTFDDETAAQLNLLEYFMREEVDVQTDPKTKRLPYAQRKPAIETAWERRQDALERMFPRRR